jgi:hypothetical protein
VLRIDGARPASSAACRSTCARARAVARLVMAGHVFRVIVRGLGNPSMRARGKLPRLSRWPRWLSRPPTIDEAPDSSSHPKHTPQWCRWSGTKRPHCGTATSGSRHGPSLVRWGCDRPGDEHRALRVVQELQADRSEQQASRRRSMRAPAPPMPCGHGRSTPRA